MEDAIRKLHPYDTPEIIAIPVIEGDARYLDWLADRNAPRADRAAASACAVLLMAALGTLHAAGLPGGGEPKLLPPEQAFRLSARALDPATIEARFDVADGYYLYRDKLRFTIEPVRRPARRPAARQAQAR